MTVRGSGGRFYVFVSFGPQEHHLIIFRPLIGRYEDVTGGAVWLAPNSRMKHGRTMMF